MGRPRDKGNPVCLSTRLCVTKKTRKWCKANMGMVWTKYFWPPNYPDHNPLDYHLWGAVERLINHRAHNTKDSLKASIKEVMLKMNKEVVARACSRFRNRVERVIEADGGFIE